MRWKEIERDGKCIGKIRWLPAENDLFEVAVKLKKNGDREFIPVAADCECYSVKLKRKNLLEPLGGTW
ncbi:MAG: hypothetical protein JWR69_4048 [Pedosphaera sp.]|nr:hypothetical protein [Pedosphaera sp.]